MEMDSFSPENFSTQSLDHLGLVADQIDQLDLIDLIDQRLPVQGTGCKLSMGERVAGMILNGLGFVDTRLYMFPDFFKKKPLTRLFGRDMDAQWFHDDSLGRCLDQISAYGVTKLFTEISLIIGQKKGFLSRTIHFDTTTLQLEGDYARYEELPLDSAALPARGYSKSHRPDLKQMVLNLATTGRRHFPIWFQAHSGNASDKTILPSAIERMNDLCQQLQDADSFLYVADSAIYENILAQSHQLKWLSRVPQTLKLAQSLIQTPDKNLQWLALEDGYHYHMVNSQYGDVEQRWALIFSEQAYEREIKTLEKQIVKAEESCEKQWRALKAQPFQCEQDITRAAKTLERKMKYHQVAYKIIPVLGHAQKGRPAKNARPSIKGYQIDYTLSQDQDKIAAVKRTKGRFIIATNECDQKSLPDHKLLSTYKAQSGVERSFKFIKDRSFQVDSIFLKTPHRIEALMMVMALCLMVYGVTQYQIRQSLVEKQETFPDQKHRPTQNPSLKWIYFLFSGVQEVRLNFNGQVKYMVSNVNDLLKQIISYCGPRAHAIYLNPET